MINIKCPFEANPPGLVGSAFIAILLLILYTKFKFSARGIVPAKIGAVRWAVSIVVAVELAVVGVVIFLNIECESILRAIPITAALLVFYTVVIFSVVFGDAYLGFLRGLVRLGVKPIDFLRDTNRMS